MTAPSLTHADMAPRRAAANLCGLTMVRINGILLAECFDLRTWFVDGRLRLEAAWRHDADAACVNVALAVQDAECGLEFAPTRGGAFRAARGHVTHWTRTNGTVGLRFVES